MCSSAAPTRSPAERSCSPIVTCPTRPATVTSDRVWLAMLDLTEDARRYNQASRAVLDLDRETAPGPTGRSAPAT